MNKLKIKEIVIPIDLMKLKVCMGKGLYAKPVEMSADDKLLYFYLKVCYDNLNREGKFLDISQDEIANLLNMSRRTVQRKLKNLVTAGLVKITFTDRNNIYKVYDFINKDFSDKPNPLSTEDAALESTKPCQFYLQEWTAPFFQCIKFGIAYDAEARSKNQHKESMFAHKIIQIWDIPSRDLGLRIEKEIKRKFDHSGCMKVWAHDGYTETVSKDDKESLIAFINDIINKNP